MTGTEWSDMKPGDYKLRSVCVCVCVHARMDQPSRITNKQVEGIAYDAMQ